MALTISPATPADMPRLMAIQFSAFGDKDPYHLAVYGPDSPPTRAAAAARTLAESAADPSLHVLKCSDAATGTIHGFAKWNVYGRARAESEWRKREAVDWCDGRARQVAEAFLGGTADIRARIWGGRPHVLCALLCVHEDFQRRGAGTSLVRWGVDRAAALGLPAYLEASPAGYPLYLKLGFREIDVLVVKAEMYGGERDMRYVAMVKEGDGGAGEGEGDLKAV